MDYPESFVWRGLNFPRVEKDDPLIAHYRRGNWIVWSEVPLTEGRKTPWWRARWQSTQFQASLVPTGEAESYERALELCLGRVREQSRRQAVSVQDLQRNLTLMIAERDALVKDLLELIVPETV